VWGAQAGPTIVCFLRLSPPPRGGRGGRVGGGARPTCTEKRKKRLAVASARVLVCPSVRGFPTKGGRRGTLRWPTVGARARGFDRVGRRRRSVTPSVCERGDDLPFPVCPLKYKREYGAARLFWKRQVSLDSARGDGLAMSLFFFLVLCRLPSSIVFTRSMFHTQNCHRIESCRRIGHLSFDTRHQCT